MVISPHAGQGWEWEQETPHLQHSAGPAAVVFMLLMTGGLNISSRLREELGIQILFVRGGG